MLERTPVRESLGFIRRNLPHNLLVFDAGGHLDEPTFSYTKDSCCSCVGTEICILMCKWKYSYMSPGCSALLVTSRAVWLLCSLSQTDFVFLLFVCPSNSLKHTIYTSGSWLPFASPAKQKERQRGRIVYIKKKLQKNNLTADSSDRVSPRERNAFY